MAAGCDPGAPSGPPADASSVDAGVDAQVAEGGGAKADPAEERVAAILAAEQRRIASLITPEDAQSRSVRVRRAAARALARIGGEKARPGLVRALADEDEEVVAWAAYGLGFWCKGNEKATVSALVTRALSWSGARSTRLDAAAAIARAVGRCGAEESEPTLVAWLAGPRERAIEAAFALGDLASAKQKLREETLVALLNLAAGSASAPPVPEALFAVGRLENVPSTVVDRIRRVATARLAEPGDARLFAVRALSRGGEEAAPELARVLTSPGMFSAAERAEAARGLRRLKGEGPRALERAVSSLAPSGDPVALTGLVSEDLGVLLAALGALEEAGSARKALRDLASLAAPPSAPASIARRVSWIRCSAAKLVVGAGYTDPLVTGCDVTPPPGSIGARTVVEVLGRAPITGARLTAWRAYASGGDVRAREAAIELIAAHDEIEGAPDVLATALSAKEPGVASTAAEVIVKQPQRAGEDTSSARRQRGKRRRGKSRQDAGEQAGADVKLVIAPPSAAVVKALLARLEPAPGAPDPEMLDTMIEAAGALGLKEALPRLEALCRSPYPTTRERAAKAIGLVRSGKPPVCEAPEQGGEAPAELDHLARGATTLSFETDVGALSITLDPELAPVAATRVVDLARAGYYRGMIVHRVVPGFVTQFGAPYGDGYGGPAGAPPLRCETSPLPFEPLRVGVALAGRDTGSSQIFVMHGRYPHLDGQYALIGVATGPWAAFVDGDVIREVRVSP